MRDIVSLLTEIGPGDMANTAYDTAWIARLGEIEPKMSTAALGWICDNQLPDGGWGAKEVHYYHDRVISTLSAMIALTHQGRRAGDKKLIEKGLLALEKITDTTTRELAAAPRGPTVGFEMIAPTLVAEAERLGIIKQQGDRILGRLKKMREIKMSKLAGIKINRYITVAFSAEMAGIDGKQMLDTENLQEENGSVGCSPSATSYFALEVKKGDKKALDYLNKICGEDGGAPNVAPFDTFETAWALWNLSFLPDYISLKDEIQHLLDSLSQSWDKQNGAGFSSEYSVNDGDGSAMVFDTLARYGITKKIDNILKYEEKDWFRCFDLENEPSLSANVHILSALRQAGYKKDSPSISKILDFLQKNKSNAGYWSDKWHISPYYTTAHAIIACASYANEIVSDAVDWLIKTQKQDGSWGLFAPTMEETAYALHALWLWDQNVQHIPRECLHNGKIWLEDHQEHEYNSLWVGKCLYSPRLVIDSAVITTLNLVN
jgi:halimadienyl-diphosphate synthase